MMPQGAQHPTELELRFGQKSDCGPARTLNEDYAQCFVPADRAKLRTKGAIFLVADGMGGHQAGEVASRQAVERVTQEYYADTAHRSGESLMRAFQVANQVLHTCAQSDPTKAGMGTTLVAAVILGRRVYVANVGDSRAYLINQQGITQITEDHSWVEEQVQAGLLTREQAERHPQRNLITRALGAKPVVEADLFEGELHEGDLLLLCTDGLSGPLSEQQIAHIARSQSPTLAASQLVAQACKQQGEDNATAVIVEAVAPSPKAPAVPRQGVERSRAPASRPTLAWVGDWLQSPGVLRIGEGRQRLVVGMAALAFLSCLCAAIAILPAAGQRLAEDPVAAPYMAPFRDGRLDGKSPDQIAAYLGYPTTADMLAAHPGQFAAEKPGMGDLWPAQRGVFLVGPTRNWSCQEQTCTFDLRMADKNYKVSYNQPSPGDDGNSLRGRQVRVFGYQHEEGSTVAAQLIERGSRWWAWWQKAWIIVYQTQPWNQAVWVYGIVDSSPNGLLDADDTAAAQQGDQVLVWGTWNVGERAATFFGSQSYRLEGNRYLPLTSEPIPMPQPTVTLMPTR
jgi:serine/threonine protein phosphatase PrpC